ncbi:hypothetical protein [Plantactinospora sp. KBS50]|uniref:hypothetical protein n=1 Tax=Plantactinospora sp. KBS50 TaxID=2024580 RepID=UPI000BAA9F83|nr:hypothetical protein [Plantactinospora sp. KBS50]ASW57110.1 hypothetical protein CIK06_27665 [Plantactinospora sp. KBS50]
MSEEEETFVHPVAARNAASNLNTAGQQLAGRWAQLVGRIDELNGAKPWGTDQPGTEFNKNYLDDKAPAKNVLTDGKELVDRFQGLGVDVASAVDGTVDTDDLISKWFPEQGK